MKTAVPLKGGYVGFHVSLGECTFSLILGPKLGRPLGYLILSLMALIGDPIHKYVSKGFRGQPRM